MFITNPGFENARGHLVSKQVTASGAHGRCFSFWYSMRHPNSGTLNLFLRTIDNSTELLWTRSGPQGRAWLRGYADTYSDTPCNVAFTGTTSSNPGAIVAVDDIAIDQSGCTAGNCHFEEDFCNWRNFGSKTPSMQWYRNSGHTVSMGGPSTDHTFKTDRGEYLDSGEMI
ncbi:unnamed protein product, partial [Ixodes hexagonus]